MQGRHMEDACGKVTMPLFRGALKVRGRKRSFDTMVDATAGPERLRLSPNLGLSAVSASLCAQALRNAEL